VDSLDFGPALELYNLCGFLRGDLDQLRNLSHIYNFVDSLGFGPALEFCVIYTICVNSLGFGPALELSHIYNLCGLLRIWTSSGFEPTGCHYNPNSKILGSHF
jgi:hypothetical protein